jgi:DNA-binding transcriptional LysR family regulator
LRWDLTTGVRVNGGADLSAVGVSLCGGCSCLSEPGFCRHRSRRLRYRSKGRRALDDAKRSWRIVLASSSVSAVWAAAEAGLGVTARTAIHVPRSLAAVEPSQGLPALGDVGLFLRRGSGAGHPVVAHLEGLVRDTVEVKTGVR